MTEAVGAVLERARHAGYPFVTATHDEKNSRSGAVLRKLSMRYYYSYGEQWKTKNIPVIFCLYRLDF